MENKKQKAIREAYGEHWDKLKDFATENGWIDFVNARRFIPNRNTDAFERSMKDYADASYRPKSLSGIGTNNGWISIESEADLPPDNYELYHVWAKHSVFTGSENKYYGVIEWWGDDKNKKEEWLRDYSHYQPIIKPSNPIY